MFLQRIFGRRMSGRALAVLVSLVLALALASASATAASADKRPKPHNDGSSMLYKVEYYYDGVLDKSKTERLEVPAPEFTVYEKDIPFKGGPGYQPAPKVPYEPRLPVEIESKNSVIKVYYVTLPDYEQYAPFTVEYYYDGVLDEDMTETVEAVAPGFIVSAFMIPDKAGPGYQLDPVTPHEPELPALVYAEGKLVKVFYVSLPGYVQKRSYTVEYYYDDELDEGKTETLYTYGPYFTVTEEDIPGKCGIAFQPDFGDMYKPQLPTVIRPGNTVIRVNYLGIPDYGPPVPFKVEYYYDGVLDESKTEIRKAVAPGYSVDQECFPDKSGSAYQLDPVTPHEPKLPTHPWGGNDVIKVFYVMLPDIAKVAPFTVDYYYDGELDETKTETLNAVAPDFKVQEVDIPDKTGAGYQLDEETPYEPDLPAPVLGSWGSDHVSVFYVSEQAVLPPIEEPVIPPVKDDKKKPDKKEKDKKDKDKDKNKNKDKAPAPDPVDETPPPEAPAQAQAPTPAPAVQVQQLARTPDSPVYLDDMDDDADQGSVAMVPPIDLEPDPPGGSSGEDGPSMTIMASERDPAKGPGGGMVLLILAAIGIAIAVERVIGMLIKRRSLLK